MGMPVIQPGTITREESVANIIGSIAAEENAIAHILNAESEKLQAIINMSGATAQDLMAAKTVVDTVIQLESTLKNKLFMFSDLICQIS